MENKIRTLSFIVAFSLLLGACSTSVTRNIDLVGKDFRFSPDTIQVGLGDLVKIKFTNPDSIPHLIELTAFQQHIALVPGGEFTLIFLADKSGTFPFVCSVPGHEEAGMVGILIVEAVN